MKKCLCIIYSIAGLLICVFTAGASSDKSINDLIGQEFSGLKYSMVNYSSDKFIAFSSDENISSNTTDEEKVNNQNKYKSPAKAFILSMVVPGLGQYYNGNKKKAVAFLGIEITSWLFNVKWNNDGDDITDEFETFQRANWSRDVYENKYLLWTYGVSDDHMVEDIYTEVSHHLPDAETQQFFEMTGKYNQFAWGWNDAVLDSNTIDDYNGSAAPRIVTDATTPNSAKRLQYETRRNDANNKYDQARKMVYVVLINRLVSSFEAMFHARSLNKDAHTNGNVFSSLKFRAKLASYQTKRDTPFVTVSFKF